MTTELVEQSRRKRGASGTPIRLSDGCEWLLANVRFRPSPEGLTRPMIDGPLDRIIDDLALGSDVSVVDVWEIAAILLGANYELDDREIEALLCVAPGEECRALADAVFEALSGPDQVAKSYSDWVRASLLANGLSGAWVSSRDLANVLAILVATGRTVPIGRFSDACRAANERKALETLV